MPLLHCVCGGSIPHGSHRSEDKWNFHSSVTENGVHKRNGYSLEKKNIAEQKWGKYKESRIWDYKNVHIYIWFSHILSDKKFHIHMKVCLSSAFHLRLFACWNPHKIFKIDIFPVPVWDMCFQIISVRHKKICVGEYLLALLSNRMRGFQIQISSRCCRDNIPYILLCANISILASLKSSVSYFHAWCMKQINCLCRK